MHKFVIKLNKLTLDLFLSKNPVQDPPPPKKKKSFESILSLYAAVTSCKKSKNVNALIFHKT